MAGAIANRRHGRAANGHSAVKEADILGHQPQEFKAADNGANGETIRNRHGKGAGQDDTFDGHSWHSRRGRFAVRLPVDLDGMDGKIADVFSTT